MVRSLADVEFEIKQLKKKIQELENEANEIRGGSSWLPSFLSSSSSKKPDAKALKLEQQRQEAIRKSEELRKKMAWEQAQEDQKYQRETSEFERHAEARNAKNLAEERRIAEENKKLAQETRRIQNEEAAKSKQYVDQINAKSMEHRERGRKECERKETEFGVYTDQKLYEQQQETDSFKLKQKNILAENKEHHDLAKEKSERDTREHSQKLEKELEERRQKLRDVDELVRQIGQESRRQYDQMRRQFEAQFEHIQNLLNRAESNRSIEKNWEVRLNALRSTSRRMQSAIGELRKELAVAKMTEGWGQAVSMRLDCLRVEATEVGDIMNREAGNLDKMYQMTGKQFVTHVASSLRHVHSFCKFIIDLTKSLGNINWTRELSSNAYNQIENVDDQIADVFSKIPTIEMLKSQFESDSDNETRGEEHVIRIEEIE